MTVHSSKQHMTRLALASGAFLIAFWAALLFCTLRLLRRLKRGDAAAAAVPAETPATKKAAAAEDSSDPLEITIE